jgi:hypothetical protein
MGRISDIDAGMADLPDRQVLLALHRHDREFDGLITQDSRMLNLEKELPVPKLCSQITAAATLPSAAAVAMAG